MTDWNNDMSAAPFSKTVMVRAGGMEFPAELIRNNAYDDQGEPVDQWCATTEVYPECWTEGCCWESNHDEVMSAQPEAWRFPKVPA